MHPETRDLREPGHDLLRRFTLAALVATTLLLGVTGCALASDPESPPEKSPSENKSAEEPVMAKKADEYPWAEVDRMVDEQRYEAASEKVATILEAARAEGDDETVTRALVKTVQLRLALHGPERAMLFLRENEAPDDPVSRLILGLVEAQALHQYLQTYGWQIRQREEITGDPDDLSLWTAERFQEEIQTLYAETWSRRDTWRAEPLGEIAAWIQQNNYPPRIRGTLRDVVTYLWLDLLVDRSWWSPEHSNEIYRLDLDALLADAEPYREAAGENASDTLTDPDVHPLRKVRLLLADLEAWHAAGDRPEAAFEARRRLVETLSHSFTQDGERERLRAELEQRLDALGRSYPWWSMGMADLAEDHRQRDAESAPMALVRALEIARDGRRAHPDSVGGERCRSIEAQIEAPSYALQAMAIDGPDRRSIEVRHRNVERLTFRAWSADFAERVRTGRSTHPDAREVASLVGTQPAAEWSVDLPPTPDYRDHRTFVTPPLGAGSWVVAASARGDFAERGNLRLAVALQIADPVPTYRHLDDGSVEITVHSGREGRPLEGVAIEIFAPYRGGRGASTDEPATRLVTAEDGIARFEPAGDPRRHRGQQRFVYRHDGPDGAEVVVDERWIHHRNEYRQDEELVLLYTDRSVYRPGQTVQWKAVVYRRLFDNEEKLGEARRFAAKSGAEIEVRLLDANGEEVATITGTTGEFGSLAGEFTLPTGRLLGYWNLHAAENGWAAILVEEYKRPTFEVTIEDPEDALRLNREAVLRGEASYYFGLPVTDGRVRWRVERVPVWPTWWFWGRPSVDSQVVAAGEDALDEDGRFTVRFVPAADERLAESGEDGGATSRGLRQPWRDVSYRYRLSAEVTSEGGETREVDRSFRIGFVAVEARFERDAEFFRSGETARFTVRRTTLEGQPRAGEGAWRIVRLDQPASTPLPADLPVELRPPGAPAAEASEEDVDGESYETEGDTLRPRWQWGYDSSQVLATWEDGAEVASGTLTHGEDGEAALATELGAGAYRLHYTTTDEFGAELARFEEFLVAGDAPLRLPAVLALAESSVESGETARVLVHSGLVDQEVVFEVWRGQERIERRALRFGSGDASTAPRILEVPITDADRGGLRFRLVALRDHQFLEQERLLSVPWTDRRLEVAFETFRDELRPGREETWRVNVRRADGEPVGAEAAEVLAYMFDRSLDLFAEHEPLDPLAFYPGSGWAPPVESALGTARFLWRDQRAWAEVPGAPRLKGDRLQVFDGWPIGGPGQRGGPMRMSFLRSDAAPQAMAMSEETVTAEMSPQVMMKASSDAAAGDSAEGLTNAEEPPSESPGDEATAPLRENFAETAFFFPSLRTDADGGVSFEFTVPDSVTSWHVWVHALTRDLRGGRAHRETRTAKELLVRPQVPRFLREGDRAVLRVVVDNTGDEPLSGTLDLDLRDPETDESLLAAFGVDATSAEGVAFTIEPKESTTLRFPLVAPRRVGPVSITVRGEADTWSDGERRPLPILPSRLHLSRSRFAMLRGGETPEEGGATRRLDFGVDDPRAADPTLTHEAFVVTVEGQLFTSLLHALPYLVEYPYTCTEQTLNRYLSTGLLSRLYDDHPEIERLAATLAEDRDTMLEVWGADDPNRRLLLEESPWLQQSRGGKAPKSAALLKVIDPEIAREQRRRSLAELEAAQLSSGAFPWWSGGPPSPWITLYVLQGLARGLEAGLDVPQPMVQQAWKYLENYWRNELDRELAEDAECCGPQVVFFAWVLSSYPDDSWTGGVFTRDDRRRLLEIGFESWRKLSPRLKLHLALALDRGDRAEDARLLFESVMDSAVSDPDLGVYWQPEDRAWLWYRDTIETHAFALRTMMELEPEDPRRHGLAQWLLLEKKLSHWKSTRATAEALHALSIYLEREGTLGADQAVRVAWADASERNSERIVFEADDPDPRRQIVLEDEAVDPVFTEGDGAVEITAEDAGFVIATATWHFATDRLPEAADGDLFAVERSFYRRVSTDDGHRLDPLANGATIAVGDEIEVQLTLRARHAAEYVHLRDPRGAGFEPVDLTSGYQWRDGLALYREIRDSGTNFFVEWLPAGEVILRHRLRATVDGTFRVGPATVQSMYAPEFTAHSSGTELVIGGE